MITLDPATIVAGEVETVDFLVAPQPWSSKMHIAD